MRFETLTGWLDWQQQLHPTSIELGLERCARVACRLGLSTDPFKLVSVAGTNGKGSCVVFMESILIAAGARVGTYSSPHLLRYNERIRIAGEPVTDRDLVDAFARVDDAREEVSLTYFEFGTLAAMVLFQCANLDVVLLEVGLGGRLDAVNLFDADVSVLTSIDLDHTEWLGPDRESIGFEKAGILRPGRPAVCGDLDPPCSITDHAARLGCSLHRLNQNFFIESSGEMACWWCADFEIRDIPVPTLRGTHQLHNLAVAIAALRLLGVMDDPQAVRCGSPRANLPGRFQTLARAPEIVIDVAHNPHAAKVLAETLRADGCLGTTHALLGMLVDKDVVKVLTIMRDVIDQWHIGGVLQPRGADRTFMEARAASTSLRGTPIYYDQVEQGYIEARRLLGETDRLIAFGCFYTAAHVLRVETSR